MHSSHTMLLVLLAICVACREVESNGGVGRGGRVKQPRTTRGFKTAEMMTARGFGKRNSNYAPENVWELMENSPQRNYEQTDDKLPDSIPLDWFVDELVNNPDFTRTVVRKFIDLNQDGILTQDELLRSATSY